MISNGTLEAYAVLHPNAVEAAPLSRGELPVSAPEDQQQPQLGSRLDKDGKRKPKRGEHKYRLVLVETETVHLPHVQAAKWTLHFRPAKDTRPQTMVLMNTELIHLSGNVTLTVCCIPAAR